MKGKKKNENKKGWKEKEMIEGKDEIIVNLESEEERRKKLMLNCNLMENEEVGMMEKLVKV